MADALKQRTTMKPEQLQRLQRRLKTVEMMPHILEAIKSGQSELLQSRVLEFETSLVEEPEYFTSKLCNLLLFFIYPLLTQKTTLDHLLTSWPASSSQTSKLLLPKIVASRIFLQQLLTHPLDQILWTTLLQNRTLLQKKFTQYLSRF